MRDGRKLTLEERLERAERSQAASPEAAVSLVRRMAQTETALVFTGRRELELMSGLIGDSMEAMEEEVLHYSGFCRCFLLALEDGGGESEASEPFRPVLGTRAGSAVVLLGLMLLDHARGRDSDKSIYHCTRMTLGQYVDALSLFFQGDGPADRDFRCWRDSFLRRRDLSVPLKGALADILRQYTAGWRVLKRLDHILCCMEDLSRCLKKKRAAEQDRALREAMRRNIAGMGAMGIEVVDEIGVVDEGEGEDEDETWPDPYGHYYALACEHPEAVPDPCGEETVRNEIFLPDRDFSPRALEAAVKEAPSPEFRALLEEHIDPERLAVAMAKVNTAVTNLFMLWTGPYPMIGGARLPR